MDQEDTKNLSIRLINKDSEKVTMYEIHGFQIDILIGNIQK